MSLPFVSLNAVTAAGPGEARDLEGVRSDDTAVTAITGSPGGIELYLEGSHDETTWIRLSSLPSGATTVGSHLVRYVRANLISISGGSSPTVTVTIASGEQ